MLRPQPARWFEILAARDDATLALEALAATGAVELEASASATPEPLEPALQPLLAQYGEFATRYGAFWPPTRQRCSAFPEPPVSTMERSLATIRRWAASAEPAIARLQAIEAECVELALWSRVLDALDGSALDFARLGQPGPVLHKRLLVLPADAHPELPPGVLVRNIPGIQDAIVALMVGGDAALQSVEAQAASARGRVYAAPAWLAASVAESLAYVPSRLHALEHEQAALRASLEALERRHSLERALGDASRLQWVARNVHALEQSELFCRITGWTSDMTGHRLATAIDGSGARALLHFPPPPPDARAPLLLDNPWWARPFEIFARALGMPSRNEADPSALLALAVPLMFGYMFGDAGQGLVLAITGCALRRRFAMARLLIAGGIAATVFGLLFGSAFSLHLLHPSWVAPLDAPLTVLMVPLAGGALLLVLGLLLDATEAHWRGELLRWLASDAGILVAYIGILAAAFAPAAIHLVLAGAALYCCGHAMHARRAAAALTAAAELVERLVQLLINTLSFARVGAFALAHAGLSSAIVALMSATESVIVRGVVLVLGNVVVLVLETMVVSIQTTRLVLFEFFTRFLRAEGRVFVPLAPPPSASSALVGAPHRAAAAST
jgi:V/A-type H+-transporting ATPase subunit I